jgi:hypothetical protein
LCFRLSGVQDGACALSCEHRGRPARRHRAPERGWRRSSHANARASHANRANRKRQWPSGQRYCGSSSDRRPFRVLRCTTSGSGFDEEPGGSSEHIAATPVVSSRRLVLVRSGQHASVTRIGVERQHAYPGHGPRPSPALVIAQASHLPRRQSRIALRAGHSAPSPAARRSTVALVARCETRAIRERRPAFELARVRDRALSWLLLSGFSSLGARLTAADVTLPHQTQQRRRIAGDCCFDQSFRRYPASTADSVDCRSVAPPSSAYGDVIVNRQHGRRARQDRLPEPLAGTYYFTLYGDRIARRVPPGRSASPTQARPRLKRNCS